MAPAVRQPVKTVCVDALTMSGPGGEKTQPTGTVLEEVVVDDVEEVSLLEVVDMTLEDAVVEEEVSLV